MKRIFIGSSTESTSQAKQIADVLNKIPDVEAIFWTDVFRPGLLVFEAIEKMARSVAGAVLLAAPDDTSVIRDTKIHVPRTNVMIELGYLAAILGRERIALCKYDETTLATDLAAFTFIGMGKYPEKESAVVISDPVKTNITRWATSLSATAKDVPQAEVLHGYSGRWKFNASFDSWFDIEIKAPNYVNTEGYLDICIPRSGWGGYGCAHLDLYIQLDSCYVHFRCTDRITAVRCEPDGSLCFTSTIFSRKRTEVTGKPPQREGFEDEIHGNNTFQWVFKPHEKESNRMTGCYELLLGSQRRASSTVIAEKQVITSSMW